MPVVSQVTPVTRSSVTFTFVSGVLPLLVATYSYGTSVPGVSGVGSGGSWETCLTRLSPGSAAAGWTLRFRIRWTSVNSPVDAAKPNL